MGIIMIREVYWNPNEQKIIFSITGSHKPSDWIITNPNLALGRLKNTSRYLQCRTKKTRKMIF